MKITSTQPAIAANMIYSCVLHSTVGSYLQNTLFRTITIIVLNMKCVQQCEGHKDTNNILEKDRSRNVVKALIIDAVESHLLLKCAKYQQPFSCSYDVIRLQQPSLLVYSADFIIL